MVCRDVAVLRVKRNELDPEGARVCRHQGQKPAVLIDRQYAPHRLNHFPGREVGHRLLHCRNQVVHPKEPADDVLV